MNIWKRLLSVLLRGMLDTEEVISEAWLLRSERRKKREGAPAQRGFGGEARDRAIRGTATRAKRSSCS